MTARREDALSWDGDDDPTLNTGVDAAYESDDEEVQQPADDAPVVPLPAGFTAVGRNSDSVRRAEDGPVAAPADAGLVDGDPADAMPAESAPLGNVALVALGILGGIYALWTIGWIVGGLRVQGVAGFLVSSDGSASPLWTSGNLVAVWLAVLAPAIWFGTVVWLTRRGRMWLRWVLLVVGAVLLVPWPFIMVGAVGA